MSTNQISDKQIKALRSEAVAAGDYAQADICDRALTADDDLTDQDGNAIALADWDSRKASPREMRSGDRDRTAMRKPKRAARPPVATRGPSRWRSSSRSPSTPRSPEPPSRRPRVELIRSCAMPLIAREQCRVAPPHPRPRGTPSVCRKTQTLRAKLPCKLRDRRQLHATKCHQPRRSLVAPCRDRIVRARESRSAHRIGRTT